MDLRVMTYNVLNTSCRYEERKPLIRASIAKERPDIVGLQEVNFKHERDLRIEDMRFEFSRGIRPSQKAKEDGFLIQGVATMLGKNVLVGQVDNLFYDNDYKLAQRINVTIHEKELVFVNTHLNFNMQYDYTLRAAQVSALLAWLSPISAPVICVGDFNFSPTHPLYPVMRSQFRSAYWEVHGCEPVLTFPTGLWGPFADDCKQEVLDYIWYRGEGIRPVGGALAGTQGSAEKRLYGSDHYAIVADFELMP
jgi:endonuclease/exonuclease/phosphatase family metal-dependent hydrolase